MLIQVTQEDIEHGEAHDCEQCPVARAINRVLKPGFHSEVGIINFEIVDDSEDTEFESDMPEIASQFIENFDSDEPAEEPRPFSFEIEIPAHLCL